MLRRTFILSLSLLRADERTDAVDALAPLASALSEGDKAGLLRIVPQDQEELRTNLLALIARADVTSSVTLLSAADGSAEFDWYLEIRNRTTETVVERRQGKVQIRYRKRKLLSVAPAAFFAPPRSV